MAAKELLGLGSLANHEIAAIDNFVGKITKLFGDGIVKVILYGSKARGNARFDSDIDLLVILKQDDYRMRKAILQSAAKTSLDFDILLSIMAMSEVRWQEHQGLSIYTNIQKEGIPIEIKTVT